MENDGMNGKKINKLGKTPSQKKIDMCFYLINYANFLEKIEMKCAKFSCMEGRIFYR
jgi:hypothetical protein